MKPVTSKDETSRSITFEYRWAEDHNERLPALATELVRREVAVIVTVGGTTSAVAAKSATGTIPIVFAIGGDPIKLGLVASLNQPGGNITGVSFLIGTLVAKQFEVLHETVANGALIGFLVNQTNAGAEIQTKNALAAAESVGQKLLVVQAHTDSELEAAFVTLAQQRAGALLVGPDPFFIRRRDKLVGLAASQKLPVVYSLRQFAMASGAPASLKRIASLASMRARFLREKNRPICRSSSPRKLSWSSTSRPPGRLASTFPTR